MDANRPYGTELELIVSAAAQEELNRSESTASSDTATEGDEISLENEIRVSHPRQMITDSQNDIKAQRARGLPAGEGLSLIWKDLSVRGEGGGLDIHYQTDLGTLLFPWTSLLAKRRIGKVKDTFSEKEPVSSKHMHWSKGDVRPKRGQPGLRPGQRFLIEGFTGCLRPGEMMLVVGRPGSGCTTFLKSLAGQTVSYSGVDGDVYYGALDSKSKEFKALRGDVVFNDEEDVHDPNLLVGRTIDFALRVETPGKNARPLDKASGKPISESKWRQITKAKILNALGIAHTTNTKVSTAQ